MNKIVILLALQIAGFVYYLQQNKKNTIELSDANFIEYTGISKNITKNSFVFIYNPKCQYCKKFPPIIDELSTQVDLNKYGVYSLDCSENRLVCRQLNITKVPTFLYFTTENKVFEYARQKTVEKFTEFMTSSYQKDLLKDYTFKSYQVNPIYSDQAYFKAAIKNIVVNVGGPIQLGFVAFFAALMVLSFLSIIVKKIGSLCCKKKVQVQVQEQDNKKDN